jgi:CBS domain-containing protein
MPPDRSEAGRSRQSTQRPLWSSVPQEWFWRAGAGVGLVLALLFTALALLSSMWWGLLSFVLLAVTIVCLVRSEPEEIPAPPPRTRAAAPPPEPPREERRPRPASAGLTVQDVMTPNPTAMRADAPVTAAARAMRDLDIGAVVVVEDDQPLGIVTDRDIVVRALARTSATGPATVGDVCSRPLATVPAGMSVEDALDVMEEKSVRRLPVTVSRSVVGMVSMDDLVGTSARLDG